MSRNFPVRFVAVCAAFLASACASSETPTSASTRLSSSADAVGDRDDYINSQPQTGIVRVCAFFDGTLGLAARFTASAPAGEDVLAGEFELMPRPYCIEVWNATSDATVPVSAALLDVASGWSLERIVAAVGDGVTYSSYEQFTGVTSATVEVNRTLGGYLWFKFVPEVAPPDGGQGCTPGYWRQPHHYDSWASPYSPTTLFSDVFADAFPGQTLGQVVALGGGGVNALGRMAVAGLLNAASPDVSFDLSVERVISGFNAAYASGDRRNMNEEKNLLDILNNQGCPLN